MRKDITVAAEPRATRGKNEARRTRAAGAIPAVLYGTGGEAVAVSVSPKEINSILHSKSGQNTIFNVAVSGGENTPVMIIDSLRDPVKDRLLHADLMRIDLTKKRTVKIPVHVVGEPRGVKIQGGSHDIVTREVEVECLPEEIPEDFTLDATDMMIGQSLRASDVPLTGSMTLVSPPDTVISHVVAIRTSVTSGDEEQAAEPEVAGAKGKKEEKKGED